MILPFPNHEEAMLSIARGLVRSMTPEELLANLDLSFQQHFKIRIEILERIGILIANQQIEHQQVEQLIVRITESVKKLHAHRKQSADKTIYALVRLLPPQFQRQYCVLFLQDRRMYRRKLGYRLAQDNFIPEYKPILLGCFLAHKDQQALVTIARNCEDMDDTVDFLLDHVEELWVKARVFEKLFLKDANRALALMSQHPIAFAWGAARANYVDAVPSISNMLRDQEINGVFEHYSLLIWTLGKLTARQQLIELGTKYAVDKQLPSLFDSND